MIKSKYWLRLAMVMTGVILVIGLGAWRYYWVKFIHPVEVFRAQELESVQYFDALNAGTLNELPVPPEGMKLMLQGTSGILSPTNVHGRILILRYSVVNNTDAALDNILDLYKSELIEKGWEEKEGIRMVNYYSQIYSQGTACVELVALYGAPREFEIQIWHDFLSQEFSPSLPDSELLYNWDMGKTDIVTCP
jgi:hypothetical protein